MFSALLALLAGCTCREGTPPKPVDPAATDPVPTVPAPSSESSWDTAASRDTAIVDGLTWEQITPGAYISCGRVSDGTMRCWGADACQSTWPSKLMQVSQISVAQLGGCALRPDGSLKCWCCDADFQGICTDMPTSTGFTRVEVGGEEACAQDAAGVLTCWGYPPVVDQPPPGPVLDYAVELNYAAAILPDGSIYYWGEGNLWGDDHPPAGVVFTDISLGRRFACGLDDLGAGHCWGDTGFLAPYPPAPAGTFAQVSAYGSVSCFVDLAGTVSCVNSDWDPDIWQTSWVDNIPALPFAQISVGEWVTCGVTTSGEGYCWGGSWHDIAAMAIPKLGP
jgi:hypothetical protein